VLATADIEQAHTPDGEQQPDCAPITPSSTLSISSLADHAPAAAQSGRIEILLSARNGRGLAARFATLAQPMSKTKTTAPSSRERRCDRPPLAESLYVCTRTPIRRWIRILLLEGLGELVHFGLRFLQCRAVREDRPKTFNP